jgi:hypothetical protein
MPFGAGFGAAIAGGIASAGAGALISGLTSPGTSGGSGGGGSNYYVPTGLQTADQQWQDLQKGNINAYNQYALAPYGYTSLEQGIQANNLYGPQYQAGAGAAGDAYRALAGDFNQQAIQNWATQGNLQALSQNQYGNLNDAGNQAFTDLRNAGAQVYNTAMDPQSALYNRTVQQLQDQYGATNSMYGLGSSAAGAGVANQGLNNFNIDWQNAQLQRQLQGLQGYAGAYGQGAGSYQGLAGTANQALNQGFGTALNYGNLAGNQANLIPGLQLSSGQVPYQTGQQIAQASGNLGNTFGQYLNSNVYSPAQSFQGQAIPYMNYGQGAQAIPYQAQAQGAGAAGSLVSQGINQGLQNFSGFGSPAQSGYFGTLQSPGNYTGAGYGGFGQGDTTGYTGGGNTYGFTLG